MACSRPALAAPYATVPGGGPVAGDAADVDDAAALGLRLHQAVGTLGTQQRGRQVQLDDAFDESRGCAGEFTGRSAAGIVHQHVKTPVPRGDFRVQARERLGVPYIAGAEGSAATLGVWQHARRRATAHHHLRPGLQECARDAGADTARAARHQDHGAWQTDFRRGLEHGSHRTVWFAIFKVCTPTALRRCPVCWLAPHKCSATPRRSSRVRSS